MTAATLTLTDFLLARIAEDEAAARQVAPDEWGYDVAANREVWSDSDRISMGVGRVLAECEAKRRIVEVALPGESDDRGERARILRILAAVYADHPDYDETWRP